MDPSGGFRALNPRRSPLYFLLPRPPTRPSLLADLGLEGRRKFLSPPPKASRTPRSLSCSLERDTANSHFNGIAGAVSEVSCDKLLQVVLVSPQIAGNTGCIARTCAASAVALHLVEPLGYQVDDSKLKRAGLDYWPYPVLYSVCTTVSSILILFYFDAFILMISIFYLEQNRYVVVKIHSSWAEFMDYFKRHNGEKRLLAFTKRGTWIHSDFSYKQGDWLVFGSETSGLPAEALLDCQREGTGGGTIRIPMIETYVRCLNLSVSVGIALYEASRQLNYEQIKFPAEVGSENQRLFISEDIYG